MLLRCESLEPHVSEWDGPAVLMPLTGFDGGFEARGVHNCCDACRDVFSGHRSPGRLAAIRRASSRIRASRLPDKGESKNTRAAVATTPQTLGRYHRPLRRVYRGSGRRQLGRAARPIPRGRSFANRCEACLRSGPWLQPLQYRPPPFCHQLNLVICIESVTGVTQKTSPLDEHVLMRGLLGPMK
jgi:hypothetical protein